MKKDEKKTTKLDKTAMVDMLFLSRSCTRSLSATYDLNAMPFTWG